MGTLNPTHSLTHYVHTESYVGINLCLINKILSVRQTMDARVVYSIACLFNPSFG